MIGRCLQNKENIWELNKVWKIWDQENNKFVNIPTLRVVAYSDCPFDADAMTDLFASAGIVLDKEDAMDDVLNMFADDAAKIREQEGQFGGGMEDFMSLLQNFDDSTNGTGDDSAFEDSMMKWMQMILKKDVLHEPIQKINSLFPEWIETRRETLTPEEIDLYSQQQVKVQEIEQILSSSDDPDMASVMAKFNEMMAICNFPQELLSEVFESMGVDMNDLDSLTTGASDCLNLSQEDTMTFENLASQFMNSSGDDDLGDLNELATMFGDMNQWFS